jgi:hypothetical protein
MNNLINKVSDRKIQLFNYLNLSFTFDKELKTEDSLSNLITTLLTSFNDIFGRLNNNLKNKILKYEKWNQNMIKNVFNLVCVKSVKCKEMLTVILSDVLNCDSEYIEGMLAIITKDTSQTNSIQYVANQLDLNRQLSVNLIRLVSKNTQKGETYSA